MTGEVQMTGEVRIESSPVGPVVFPVGHSVDSAGPVIV
jgi:hypothetical protein